MLDPRIPDGLAQIRTTWTFPDLVHGHEYLDQLDAIRAREERARGTVG